jgi:hypothetical protein
MNNQETIEIIEELLNSIKTLGYKKTLNLLKVQKKKEVNDIDDFDTFVLDTIVKEFEITLDDLLYGRYIRGEVKYAIGFVVFYLYEKKTLGQIHKNIFKFKNKTLLSKYRQIILDLKKSHKADEKFITIKEKLDKKIQNFKKK